ncbi:hypothetical protein YT1_2979 [Rhodococcus ruber]|nr:hypothetical protein YT1_2979 [Rhodococcus ruber]
MPGAEEASLTTADYQDEPPARTFEERRRVTNRTSLERSCRSFGFDRSTR